ncbi:hypothetical protein G8A07_08450 [Roseateles sp. DAIF2]|uniref:hypothetical protein n=1 Tax=Roseateles sp. DAIF2 TaxID=2714952 RepID=UPI0018A2DFFB|nr:hypothetical protein [Roseateles sp. DAIF2]QPF72955.1 hypothetical protein G8A07_08450 [Roseateles sp. DAIF2]
MNKYSLCKTSIGLLALLLPLGVAQAARMSAAEHKRSDARITADYKADEAGCKAQSGNAKDICLQEAKARRTVAHAELQHSYSGKARDWTRLQVAKAESAYAVAKERCDDKAGQAKDVCVEEAKAVETKALAEARMNKRIEAARSDAASDKNDAGYKLATEKCESQAGDAKSACIAQAKARFGKS